MRRIPWRLNDRRHMNSEPDTNAVPSLHKQLPLALERPAGKMLETFIATGNEMAVHHLERLCTGTDPTNYQLYLWGAGAVGKSHLLQAACCAVTERGGRSAWLPLAELSEYDPEILEGLETLDFIGVDELDVIKGHSAWQRAMFKLINEVRASGCRLAMAGRQNPAAMEFELQDLSSRLVWGAVYRLAALDDADKMKVLYRVGEHLGGELTDDALSYLLKNYPRDLKELIVMVERLAGVAKSRKRRITVPLIKEIL